MEVIEKAPAKINLGLDIAGRCDDGYHQLAMIMTSVDLNDYVTVRPLEEDLITVTSNSNRMPLNKKNDVYKAAQLIKKRFAIRQGVAITLDKRIPICAGLGGGSSDAAATIRALNQLWHLGMDKQTMAEIGFAIGSDVPYCLKGGCALVTGKGEQVELLPKQVNAWVVLVKPHFGVSTRHIFKEIDVATISRVDISALAEAILAQDYPQMLRHMGNSLEDITIAKRPFIQKIKDRMLASGADIALMTGSGPTVFALCSSSKKADRVVNSVKGFCQEVYKVRTL